MAEATVKPEQAESMPGIAPTVPAALPQDAGERPRYKSYRKKYRKMKLNFDKLMEEANELFVSESKAAEIARRIQEQNDQLLDVLLEINDSKHTPANRRYDLTSPSSRPSHLPELPRGDSLNLPPPTKSLRSLQNIAAHTPHDLVDTLVLPADLQADSQGWPGFLTMDHEEAYINAADAKIANVLAVPDARSADTRPPKHTLTERDFAIQNPVSVHNWLRKHQPQVFDGKDKESERGGKSPPPGRKKKPLTKPEPADTVDEDGDADSVAFGSAKAKRKREDDAYRPKGGHSRPQKRKREVGEAENKAGKKPRKSNGAEDES